MVPRLIGSQEELNVPAKIARIYRRYLLANARGNVDWSYRWFALFERMVRYGLRRSKARAAQLRSCP